MEDSRIIELYFDRNEEAIRATELKFSKLCHGISHNILGNTADAEECVNDTYLGVWNSIPPERPKNLKAYVARIARNLSLKRLEYNTADKRSGIAVDFSELEGVLADHETAMREEDIGGLINDFLKQEKEDARNVFLRKYWFFDSVESIAARYGFSESKVKSTLFHTRARLRKYLESKGVYV